MGKSKWLTFPCTTVSVSSSHVILDESLVGLLSSRKVESLSFNQRHVALVELAILRMVPVMLTKISSGFINSEVHTDTASKDGGPSIGNSSTKPHLEGFDLRSYVQFSLSAGVGAGVPVSGSEQQPVLPLQKGCLSTDLSQ